MYVNETSRRVRVTIIDVEKHIVVYAGAQLVEALQLLAGRFAGSILDGVIGIFSSV